MKNFTICTLDKTDDGCKGIVVFENKCISSNAEYKIDPQMTFYYNGKGLRLWMHEVYHPERPLDVYDWADKTDVKTFAIEELKDALKKICNYLDDDKTEPKGIYPKSWMDIIEEGKSCDGQMEFIDICW